jgi:ATP-binding cassette, subfamily G (WHITE), member 2, PDR
MSSPERKLLLAEMEGHEQKYPKGKEALDEFTEVSQLRKSKHMPKKSPYTVTIWMQIGTCITRAYQRMWGDKSTLGATLASNMIMSLVIGSVFYNTPNDTNGFFSKVALPLR